MGAYVELFDDLAARGLCLELAVDMSPLGLKGEKGKEFRAVTGLQVRPRSEPKGALLGSVRASLATLDEDALRLRAQMSWGAT